MIQILFPWLVQGVYLNCLLLYFMYARTVTKSWCSVGMFFNRCTNCKFINWYPDVTIWPFTMYSVFEWKNFKILSYRWAFLESTEISASEELNALEKAPPQFIVLWLLNGKGEVQIMLFRKLSRKCNFLFWFCTSSWSETIYIYIYINYSYPLFKSIFSKLYMKRSLLIDHPDYNYVLI